MQKPLMMIAILMLFAAASFAQTTTNSTNPKSSPDNKRNRAEQTEPKKGPEPAAKQGNAKSGTTRSHSEKNAKAGAGKADQTERAQVNGKTQATSHPRGAINNTEPDTVVKKGSGSSPRNRKNKTGKTNNYNNEATKRNSN